MPSKHETWSLEVEWPKWERWKQPYCTLCLGDGPERTTIFVVCFLSRRLLIKRKYSLVVNAIHCVFKNGYFSGICTFKKLLSVKYNTPDHVLEGMDEVLRNIALK